MTIQEAIVKVANGYIGIKEIPNNKGWKNKPDFERKMKDMGWKVGESWCMYFCKLVVYEAYILIGEEGYAGIIKNTMNGSVLNSLKKLKSCNIAEVVTEPSVGCIGIMQKGSTQLGHAFVIVKIEEGEPMAYITVEGNTDSSTGTREGDGVYRRTRVKDFWHTHPKMKVINYITFKS